ncbi:unnamed protein product [Mytilus edulis]|uniref:Uncharacterized protein n=1 Tax=Mytilus edulis TaxID=6550 RepID=A0A8S3QE43_MYTED|nr:unnamed protein product [Mytilus edulis]
MLYLVVVSLIMVVYVDSEECTRKVTQLQSSERKLRNELVQLQNVFLERLTKTDKEKIKAFIGFSAYMSQGFVDGHSKSLSEGKTLIFDMTETNTDGIYNTNTEAQRRYDGGYGEFGVELVIDGKSCGKVHADTEVRSDDQCSTGFVIKYMTEGGAARLRNIYTHSGRLLSNENRTRTTFTGWKLN